MFLAFCAFPAFKRSSRSVVPWADWVLALIGAFCAAYLFLFYRELATRPGSPTRMDVIVGITGVVIMLEATRRAMGFGMLVTTGVFMLFVFTGPYMPEVIQHRGASLERFISHMWLTTEGVYGVALGVSVQFIFLFVLFGTLLDIAGAGNYMLQVSLALLGHLRGGPAKVAVVSSALNGVVSGSSVSNVVSGGIFTIPLMKRTGYSRREGRRDRGGVFDQRPDHAAGDGRGRVPDGRVRRHSVRRDHQARGAARRDLLRGAVLHRAPRGAEARPEAARARAHARRGASG